MFLKRFSHIYLEEGAETYPLAKEIVDRFSNATVVPIRDYKDVFARPGKIFSYKNRLPS